jgi:hypothetical protein
LEKILLKTGINLYQKLSEFVADSDNLFIFVPYIKHQTLKQLLDLTDNCKIIVVRWEPKDLILGSSDLEVYDYCQRKKVALYRNPRLHLKAFVDDYKKCILGSANISSRALNIPESNYFNYELGAEIENLSFDDRLYFNTILNDSTLINDSIYTQLKTLVDDKKQAAVEPDFSFPTDMGMKDFLISALPMSFDVPSLLRFCATRNAQNETELNCALHDLALYNLSLELEPKILREKLTEAFFNHPFIKSFLKNLEEEGFIFFGSAKDWIHKNCADVPTPRKWEITENIQILYRWIVELGEGKYEVDVPGARSERLRIVADAINVDYLSIIANLNTDTAHFYGANVRQNKAPHKPLLLLSVIDLFAKNQIKKNLIEPSHELELIFFNYWQLVRGNKKTSMSFPFYHLSNEPGEFWKLKTKLGREKDLIDRHRIDVIRSSINELRNSIYGAELNVELYQSLQSYQERKKIRELILDQYFIDSMKPVLADNFW